MRTTRPPHRVWLALIALLALAPAARAADKGAAKEAPVQMEAYKVEGNYIPRLSFGISLDVWRDNVSRLVTSIVIRSVRADSEAEQQGLAPQMRVLRIDGRPAEEFEASFFKGTELNRIFVERRNGDTVALEIWDPQLRAPRTVVLTEHRNNLIDLPSKLDQLSR
ncbi:MAG: hypothetical protein JSR48_02290 [Verrucomicrobia bacterium]|nr:hypothetical protein [Verrucomicrobiota bacterium]